MNGSKSSRRLSFNWAVSFAGRTKARAAALQSAKSSANAFNFACAGVLSDASPELMYWFSEQTLQPGPTVSLKCIATGNPPPQFTWTLDGFLVSFAFSAAHNHCFPSPILFALVSVSHVHLQIEEEREKRRHSPATKSCLIFQLYCG